MSSSRRSFLSGILLGLMCAGLVVAVPVFAQDLSSFAEAAGFSTGPSITVIIARIIRTVISLVGVVAVVMLVYAGFLWMTSGGDTTRIGKAKKILTQAVVGLVIVLSSFVIVSFVINRIVEATGGEDGGGGGGGGGGPGDDNGLVTFSLSSVNTQCAEALRNLQLQLVFTKAVDPTSVAEAIVVRETGGEPVDGTFATVGKKVTFTPSAACPAPNDQAKCFRADTEHELFINASFLKSTSGSALRCVVGAPCETIPFRTGSGIDTSGPIVSMLTPTSGQSVTVGTIERLQASTRDDTGVSSVDFFVVDADPLFTAGLDLSTSGALVGGQEPNAFSTDENREWDTVGSVTNRAYPVWASASDCAGNTAVAAKVFPIVRAAHCDNGVRDEDFGETGVDCGGDGASPNYCGECEGGGCTDNSDCVSGVCENGECVSNPRIDLVSPGDGAVGNLVTISGRGFGNNGGSVRFLGGELDVQAYECNGSAKWSDKQIIVQVPDGATNGPLAVADSNGKTDRTNDTYGPLSADFDVNAVQRPGLCEVVPVQSQQGAQVTLSGLGFGQQKGSSTVYFKNFVSPSLTLSLPETQYQAVVPNMPAGAATTQLFTGDYQCVDATGSPVAGACAQDSDCGEGNTCATSWCSETLAYCASDQACGEEGGSCASVRVGSNKLAFIVQDTQPPDVLPDISYIDSGWKACSGGANSGAVCATDAQCADGTCQAAPNWGPVGQSITIYGTNFGSEIGTVHFTSGLEQEAIGDTNFPPQCEGVLWTDTAITVKVPNAFLSAEAVNVGPYQVSVRKGFSSSNAVEFVVVDGAPGPSVCKLDPVAGPVGTDVDLYGEHLGAQQGTVTFFDHQQAVANIWNATSVKSATVPAAAQSGPVWVVTAGQLTSNSLNFTVGSCQEGLVCPVGTQCCASGACQLVCDGPPPQSHLAYRISTSAIPVNPRVLVACDANAISPSPWNEWPDSQTVCRNAAVSATFTQQMDQPTLVDHVLIERCTQPVEDGCAAWEGIEGEVETDEVSFTWTPDALFGAGTLYRVTVLGGEDGVKAHEDAGGAPMLEDYSWEFLTGGEGEICEVGDVLVSPSAFRAVEEDQQVGYSAKLIAEGRSCVLVDPRDETIAWSSNDQGALVNEPVSGAGLDTASVTALFETQGNPAKIRSQVTSAQNQPADTGDLIIDFSDPTVAGFFPNCSTACVNARPWVRFKADMDPNFAGAVALSRCENALCAPGALVPTDLVAAFDYLAEGNAVHGARTLLLSFRENRHLEANTWYRVVLDGDLIQSTSGVALKDAGSNFGSEQNLYFEGDFSWKFKTKDSDISCGVDSISVSPKDRLLKAIGERQALTATAYGAPDDCDATGQALQDVDYSWQAWTSADHPDNAGDGGGPSDVAFLLRRGAIALATTLPSSCTAQCVNAGTVVNTAQALCGDGVVNGPGKKASEQCDDGNTQDGDGCSRTCLREGVSATCGNGVLEADEICDDGNIASGDGCSTSCLNEGSQEVGSICGDGIVDFAPQTGGEDCDDRNTKNGDGCSFVCLFEGSEARGGRAICGNAGNPETGEDCDDGNIVDGDGCSARCLHEGSSFGYAVPSVCGDGIVGTGEDCDDGNAQNNDGCSRQCLKEGASLAYEVPSFCGDAVVRVGEECDVLAGQTLVVGGFAAAQIGQKAPQEVGDGGGRAYTIITAEAEGIEGSALLGIECACQTDLSCGNTSQFGCGTGSCCFARPRIRYPIIPIGNGPNRDQEGFCRNTAVSVGFTQKMDSRSFDGNIRLRLFSKDGVRIQENPSLCPATYQTASRDRADGFFARAWDWLKQGFWSLVGREVSAALGDCDAPITFSTTDLETGQRVNIELQELLEANAVYRIEINGDPNPTDAQALGVVSEHGVGVCAGFRCRGGKYIFTFRTGANACLLEAVEVEDLGQVDRLEYESASPNFFSKKGETHAFESSALTYRDGLATYEEIQPIRGHYTWEWSWGSSFDDADPADIVKQKPEDPDRFESSGNNGVEQVVATARIEVDGFNVPTTQGKQTSGTTEVTALVCERPWPALDSPLGFPYLEKTDPNLPSNFGFFYCRDRAPDGAEGDLPALVDPVDVTSVSSVESGLLQELLFPVENTKDAIGVRVYQNPTYLSPEAWFQSKQFTGGSVPIMMDGYAGVQSGNTAYIAAANQHAGQLYSNMYVISFNPDAGAEAQEIFARVLKNWRFNENKNLVGSYEVPRVGLCKIADAYVQKVSGGFVPCSWDGDCVETLEGGECTISKLQPNAVEACPLHVSRGAFCDSGKDKLRRDLQRLTDVTTITAAMDAYRNGHAGFPTLQQGTFVPALSTSKWPSWTAALADELGRPLPTDPLNVFWQACEGLGEGYDPATCFNGLQGRFICPNRSHVYGYQSVGGEAYKLFAQLEYAAAPWANRIDLFGNDKATVVVEYGGAARAPGPLIEGHGFVAGAPFCDAQVVWGVSTVCGDGVVGANERCEQGQGDVADCQNGKINVACLSEGAQACRAFQSAAQAMEAGAVCVPYRCGNGVLEAEEECDDGAFNGTYGHCGANCSLATAFVCGDGYLAGGEQCDCGDTAHRTGATQVQNRNGSWAQINLNGLCAVANGQYRTQGACSYDCKAPGPSCGDGEVQVGQEECDGGFETSFERCGLSKVCVGDNDAGRRCQNNNDCHSGVCSTATYQLSKTRSCRSSNEHPACTWNQWSLCLGGVQACGNGKVEGNEQCDDGNPSNLDACKNDCTPNICGDGHLNRSAESCDDGDNNIGPNHQGAPCSAPYNSSCNYCTTQCQFKTYSGSFCGDGVINGNEFCDGTQIPYGCLKVEGQERTQGGTCPANQNGQQGVCEDDFICRQVGVCNGGSDNGKPCTVGTHIASCAGGGVCVAPTCANDCTAACPFTLKTTSVLVQSEAEGAQPLQSIELYSYLNADRDSPDNAVLHLPACLVGSKITANVDNSKVIPPNVDIVFVTDLSGSMAADAGGGRNRIQVVADATVDAISKLFGAYQGIRNAQMRIGLVSFGGWTYNRAARVDAELLPGALLNKQLLISKVNEYPTTLNDEGTYRGGFTPTANGVQAGIRLLTANPLPNTIQILILLSDGKPTQRLGDTAYNGLSLDNCALVNDEGGVINWNPESAPRGAYHGRLYEGHDWCVAQVRYDPTVMESPDARNIKFYSAVITSNDRLKSFMKYMSSESCEGGVDQDPEYLLSQNDCESGNYAFDATDQNEIKNMYQKIVESILGATTTVTAIQDNRVDAATGATPVGNNVALPMPDTFQCQARDFTMPIKTTFYGTGTMKFDNFKFTYCPRL